MRTFERAVVTDLPELVLLLADAKNRMAQLNIQQWTDTYPNEELLLQDIQAGEVHLLKEENCILCMGTFTRRAVAGKSFDNSKNNWFIKRLITRNRSAGKGLGKAWIEACIHQFSTPGEQLYSCTNHTNLPMQRLFEKADFLRIDQVFLEHREQMGSFYIYERKIGHLHE